jgi:cytochrome P450
VAKAFSLQSVDRWRPRMAAIVDELLDEVAERGELDLANDFAYPLPISLVCEMLGVPRADRDRFRADFEVMTRLVEPDLSPEVFASGIASTLEVTAYVEALCEERRRVPADDLISGLVHAHDEGDSLTHDELVSAVMVIFGAAGRNTQRLIANTMAQLFLHPDQLAMLREDASLLPSAIEEALRFTFVGGVPFPHWATVDLEFGGVAIPAGDDVRVSHGGANRDPAIFRDPDRFDITRDDASKLLSFGVGIHYCLGASLGRTEAQVAVGRLLERFPDLAPVGEPKAMFHDDLLSAIPCTFTPSARAAG